MAYYALTAVNNRSALPEILRRALRCKFLKLL